MKSATNPRLVLGLSLAALAAAHVARAELVGYWNFDEGSGTTASDFSVTNANGTLNGPPAWTTGQYGNALNFGGSLAQYVSIPLASGSPLIIGSNATAGAHSFTVSCWVYQTGLGYGEIFCFGGGTRKLFIQTGNSGGESSYVWSDSNAAFRMNGTGQVIGANAWHHIAITYDSSVSTSNYKFYYDGVLKKTQNVGSTASLGILSGESLFVGKSTRNDQPWSGKIDDLVVFNSVEDPTAIMNGTHTGMLRYWTGLGANDNWSDANNWGGAAVGSEKPLVFDTSVRLLTNTNDFAGNTKFKGITFRPTAGAFTLNGNAINLVGDVVNNSASAQTISTALVLDVPAVADSGTRTFNAAAGDIDVTNGIIENTGPYGIIKNGANTLKLAGSNTYSGTTAVNAGKLLLNSATLGNSAVTVSGVTSILAGSGTLSQLVTAESSGRVSPGIDASTTGTLAMGAGLTLHSAGLDFKLGTSSDAITVTGNLTLTGNTPLTVSQLAGFTYGTYTLITYSGSLLGGGAILPPTNTPTFGYNIVTSTPGQIRLQVFVPPATKTWNGKLGAVDNGTWDIGTTATWKTGVTPATYNETINGNDPVVFNDSAAGTATVSLNTTVSPFTVTFSNTPAKPYVVSGTGTIAGPTTLTASGTGSVTLGTFNSFTGDTVVSGGALTLANTHALAGSTLNYDNQGGALGFGSLTAATLGGLKGAQNLALDNGSAAPVALTVGGNNQNPQYNGVLSGGGGLTKTGSGTQTLTAGATYQGDTIVSAGVLTATTLANTANVNVASGTLNAQSYNGAAPLTVGFGATANISDAGLSLAAVSNDGDVSFTAVTGTTTLPGLSGSGTTLFASNAAIGTLSSTGIVNFSGAAASVTTLGDATINVSSTALTVSDGTQTTGSIYGNGSLNKTGAGTLTLGGTNPYSGSTTFTQGVLSTGFVPTGFLIFNGGTWQFTGASGTKALTDIGSADNFIEITSGNLTVTHQYDGIVKSGSGGLIVANTGFQDGGDVTVNDGTLLLSGATNIGAQYANVANIVDVLPGATVKLGNGNGGQVYYDYTFHMSGGTFDLNGINSAQTPAIDGSGIITNSVAATTGTASFKIIGNKTFSGTIVNGAGKVAVTLNGGGTWTLTGINTHTGNTSVNSGTLVLADNAGLKFAVTNTTANSITGGGTATLNGDFTIDTSAVTNSTGSWTLVNVGTLNETFNPSFTVAGAGWSETANVWTKTESGKTWTFTEASGVLALTSGTPFSNWAAAKGLVSPDADPDDDPDNDGNQNLSEFAFNGNPLSGSDNGFRLSATEDTNADTLKELTLTIAVRNGSGTPVFTGTPSPSASVDGITYTIEGSLGLTFPGSAVTETIAPTGLPVLPSGWEYRRFRLDASNGLPGMGFLRAKVTQP